MGQSRSLRQRPLTLTQQRYFLGVTFPDFFVQVIRNELRCVGEIRPLAICDNYTVEVLYKIPTRPRVRVLRPELRLASGHSRLPHVFEGNDLCLYSDGQWRPDLRISEYIIPWIYFWLRFYEVWLATGYWEGGGTHPNAPQHKSS
jgi:hypothetical protein